MPLASPKTRSRFVWRQWLHWSLVAALLIRSVFLIVPAAMRSHVSTRSRPNDGTSERIERLASITFERPPGATIGYATVVTPADAEFSRRYGIARYVVAPQILDSTDRHSVVLADFDSDSQLMAYVHQHNLVLRQHPGAGVGVVESGAAQR